MTRPSQQIVVDFDQLFARQADPGRCFRPRQQVVSVTRARCWTRFEGGQVCTAIEVGCAEGNFTRQILAERCEALLATDVSPVALDRARARCADLSHVRFERWDVLADAPPATFDLTVVMSVLEPFYRRRDLKVAREKISGDDVPERLPAALEHDARRS